MAHINEIIEEGRIELREILAEMSERELSERDMRDVIGRYTAAIEGNFVPWMAAAAVSACSIEGRYTAQENLYVEMRDDHQGMLRRFAQGAGAEPTAAHHTTVEDAVGNIRGWVKIMSGPENLMLMAALENLSGTFIPYLADMAKRLGSKDTLYTDVHGEADSAHAERFVWAVEHELKHHAKLDMPGGNLGAAVHCAVGLLGAVFLPKIYARKI